jgi:hypothetical protein
MKTHHTFNVDTTAGKIKYTHSTKTVTHRGDACAVNIWQSLHTLKRGEHPGFYMVPVRQQGVHQGCALIFTGTQPGVTIHINSKACIPKFSEVFCLFDDKSATAYPWVCDQNTGPGLR